MSLHFQYRELVWLFAGLLLAGGLFFMAMRWRSRAIRRMGDPVLVRKLFSHFAPYSAGIRFGLLSLAFAAGVVAVMHLRKPGDSGAVSRKGIDVVIALDVSKSMLATDIAPSRLDRARQLISKLMDAMPNDRIGLVLFAGQAYLQMPLTTDHGAAALFVSAASPDAVPSQGTVISEALKRSAGAFNAAERRFKAVVLISDGEDQDQDAVATARDLAEQGMMINTVGVGSTQGSYIPDPSTGGNKKDEMGNDVLSRLNETTLKEIANVTNGTYVHLENSDDAISQLTGQLGQIEKKAYGDVSLVNFKSFYWIFAGLMLLLLLAELFVPEIKKKKA
ncbi:MAG: VWA domain-containing protein [Chitinophagaceae bacterium]